MDVKPGVHHAFYLNEYASQKRKQKPTFSFSETKYFEVRCSFDDKEAFARGGTKKEAMHEAARLMLSKVPDYEYTRSPRSENHGGGDSHSGSRSPRASQETTRDSGQTTMFLFNESIPSSETSNDAENSAFTPFKPFKPFENSFRIDIGELDSPVSLISLEKRVEILEMKLQRYEKAIKAALSPLP